jgi:hypothetical protein
MTTDPTTGLGGGTTTSRTGKGAVARTKAMNWSKRLSPKRLRRGRSRMRLVTRSQPLSYTETG